MESKKAAYKVALERVNRLDKQALDCLRLALGLRQYESIPRIVAEYAALILIDRS
jgi:hypothetical protein